MRPMVRRKPADLAAMVSCVIDDVQHELPDGLTPGIAAHVLIGEIGADRVVGHFRQALVPLPVHLGPLIL